MKVRRAAMLTAFVVLLFVYTVNRRYPVRVG